MVLGEEPNATLDCEMGFRILDSVKSTFSKCRLEEGVRAVSSSEDTIEGWEPFRDRRT
jgi:hypothetical protein